MPSTDFIFVGALTELNYNIVTSGVGLRVAGIGGGARMAVVNVALDLRVINSKNFAVVVCLVAAEADLRLRSSRPTYSASSIRRWSSWKPAHVRNEPLQLGVRSVAEMAVYQIMTDFLRLPRDPSCALVENDHMSSYLEQLKPNGETSIMTALKSARILAASLGVLAFGAMAATPAMAFDKVNWKWSAHVNEWVNISACIHLNVNITGMVQVEKLQIFLGDAKASSYVAHIYNTPFYETTGRSRGGNDYTKGDDDKGHAKTYAVDDTRYYYRDAKSSPHHYERELKIHDRGGEPDFDRVGVKPLDARVELPIILASTTSIGNNQSITSDVPVFLHDGQFVANVSDREKEHCKGVWCDLARNVVGSWHRRQLRR